MKYRHKETGAIIDIACVISGAWEPVVEEKEQTPEVKPEKPTKKAPAQKRTKK